MNFQVKSDKSYCLDIKIALNLWYNEITSLKQPKRRGANLMINQMSQYENTQNQFSNVFKELQIGKLLRKFNITKSCCVSTFEVFQFLLLLAFQSKNLFRFLNSKRRDLPVSKNTYYRFLNESYFKWTKFLLLLAAKITGVFTTMIRRESVKVFVLDDSITKRNCSKSVELLARVYNHVEHKYQKGFTLLTSDGLMVTALFR